MYANMDRCCKVVTGIQNESELASFLAKEQSIREPLDFVQWRCFFIENFNDQESVFIFKCHHSLSDGMGLLLAMHSLTDHPEKQELPKVLVSLPPLKKAAIYLCAPFLMLYYGAESQINAMIEDNGLVSRVDKKQSILKNGCISSTIPLAKLLRVAKANKASINDVVMTVISNVMSEFFAELGDTKTKEIKVGMPFSLRYDVHMNNQITMLNVDMPLTETFKGGLPAVKAAIDVLKASPKPYGYYFAVFVLVSAPRMLAIYLLD